MDVQPFPLTGDVKRALAKSMATSAWTWPEVEEWIAARVACCWRIGSDAWAVTAANDEDEIDIVVAGGRGANKAAPAFLKAMLELPEHRGFTLRIEGRRGWKRFCKDWNCEEVGGGDVILTKRCA